MILKPELYHSDQTEEHRSYMVAFFTVFKRLFPNKKVKGLKHTAGDRRYTMQPIEIRSITVAHCLAELLRLQVDDEGYIFDDSPWMDPGEQIIITEDTLAHI